ncbi:permease-like cell division protein FtsX, partial [Candidatus Saccharibacteria bacterium]|nr:permease-like cell division protein FtsX [Candidatus Saccharibacteria bacterium]
MAKTKKTTSTNPTKDRLKSMVKSGSAHKIRTASRIVKYGASGFKRNIWLSAAATLVATFTLVLLFVTAIASIVLSSTADIMREKIDITIFFKPGTDITVLNSMASTMRQDPNVKNVEVADSNTEYERFLEETKKSGDKDILQTLDDENMKEIMLNNMQSTMRLKV